MNWGPWGFMSVVCDAVGGRGCSMYGSGRVGESFMRLLGIYTDRGGKLCYRLFVILLLR